MNKKIIPLFPLNVVLFPGIPLPLHIFEERYKEMIQFCMDNNAEFGVILYNEQDLSKVGCTAIVQELLKEYEDGRMDILAEGIRRFSIERVINQKSYMEAEVHFLELPTEKEPPDKTLQENAFRLLQNIMKITNPELNSELFRHADIHQLSHLIASSAGFSLADKQRLLEMDDVSERISVMLKEYKQIMERIHLHQLIKNAEFMEGNFSRN
jgi:Lon protease-like protein